MISYNASQRADEAPSISPILAEAQGHSEQTIDAVAKAIARFEAYTPVQAISRHSISSRPRRFKHDLATNGAARSGEPLSKATLYATLAALKRFFIWLAGQPGYKSRIPIRDAEYFNLSAKETRIAKATARRGFRRLSRFATSSISCLRHRYRAAGSRSDRLHDPDRRARRSDCIIQARAYRYRREQDRSRRARGPDQILEIIRHDLFPGGRRNPAVVVDWVSYLRTEKLWGLDDPLFPATKVAVGDNLRFVASVWTASTGAAPVRSGRYSRRHSRAAGLPYFNPHSFRKTLALLGGQICKTPEEYKAWSQNLGHDHVLTTFSSYGDVGSRRQAEIIRSFAKQGEEPQ